MKLNKICDVYSGFALKKFNKNCNGFPVIKIGNIIADGTLNLDECQYTTDEVNEKYYSHKGDIYIALSGATTGKIGMMNSDKKYIINQRVGIVRQKTDDIPQDFIKFFLLNSTDKILKEAFGCAQPNISPKQISEYIVPDISIDVMREICVVLDRIRNVIDCCKKELEGLDELVKARFVEMFDSYMNSKNMIEFNSICEFITVGIANSATHAFSDKGVIMFRNQNIKEDKLDDSDIVYITEDFAKKYDNKTLKENDILIVRTGCPGIACTVPKKYEGSQTFTTLIARLKNSDRTNPRYICHYINSEYGKSYVQQNSVGVAQQNFGATALSKMPICIPPFGLQNQFVYFVREVDKSRFTG